MVPPMRIIAISMAVLVTACAPRTQIAQHTYAPPPKKIDPCGETVTAPDLLLECITIKRQDTTLTKAQRVQLDKDQAVAEGRLASENRMVEKAMMERKHELAIVAQCEYEAKLGAMHVRGILMPIAEYNTIYAMCVRARVATAQ